MNTDYERPQVSNVTQVDVDMFGYENVNMSVDWNRKKVISSPFIFICVSSKYYIEQGLESVNVE